MSMKRSSRDGFLVTVELRRQPGMSPTELDGFEMDLRKNKPHLINRKNKPHLIWFLRNEINSSFKLLLTPFHAVCT